MSVPPRPSANQGTHGVSPRARYSTIPARARRQPRAAAPSRTLELGEAPLPAGLVPVAALLGLPLRPDHHMQGAGEDLLAAAGAAVHLGRPVGLHEAEVPAVGHPLQ